MKLDLRWIAGASHHRAVGNEWLIELGIGVIGLAILIGALIR